MKTLRRHLLDVLSREPRSVSSLARELGLDRRDVQTDLRHLIRSAQASGYDVRILPARCRSCDFVFGADKLVKPSRCSACKGTRLFEAQVRVGPPE